MPPQARSAQPQQARSGGPCLYSSQSNREPKTSPASLPASPLMSFLNRGRRLIRGDHFVTGGWTQYSERNFLLSVGGMVNAVSGAAHCPKKNRRAVRSRGGNNSGV